MGLSSLKKKELIALAEANDIDCEGATKDDIIEILEAEGIEPETEAEAEAEAEAETEGPCYTKAERAAQLKARANG